ncbi:unnamed protein product [Phyllotreta striolata]|uniref:Uncharacterized protein n=1 Tax=Phyllotreta striolata TaxID=444603 RepID=A0A9N9XMU2_PHYSR|nr:unnamed protein product [Phyllotreta striolata]
MVAQSLLVVAVLAVVSITVCAEPAPFFWYDYSEESSEEEDTKQLIIYLNITDVNSEKGFAIKPVNQQIPINIPVNPGQGENNGVEPLTIPIELTLNGAK